MTVTRTFYTGVELLAFKVIATSYRSDPDIYISTDRSQMYPTDSSNSLIYCEQKGSDTCFLQSGQFSIGQTIYIGIKCDTACSYSLTTWYEPITPLPQTVFRNQFRFAANSTQVFSYVIPPRVSNTPTKSIEILIEPENDYSFMEVFVNFDQSFYVQKQQASTLITKTGNAVKINSADYQWCTSCTIYLILNVQKNQRYYISTTPRGQNDNLQSTLPTTVLVSPFTQECYSYFVSGATNDLRFDVEGLTGQSDMYVTAGFPATSPNDTYILIRAAQGPQRAIVLSYLDRTNFEQPSGQYFLCFYAYTPFSAQIYTTETIFNYGLEVVQNQIRTSIIQGQEFFMSRFTNSYLNQNGTITVYVEAQGLSVGQSPPTIYYKVCNSSNYDQCSLNQSEISTMRFFDSSSMNSLFSSLATINHNPAVCPSTSGCTYLFGFLNTLNTEKIISVRINYQYSTPGSVQLNQRYVNKITQGNYFNYMILPSQNPQMSYFKNLKIKVFSTRGDGDIFVSLDESNPTFDNAIFQCRLNDDYEEIQLNLENGWPTIFQKTIYFSVYANTYTQVLIDFESTLLPIYDQKTESAQPLADKQFIYEILEDENQERSYSYTPWWSGRENRTIIFFADVVVNQILLYTTLNKYPQHFLTSLSDTNGTIAIYGSNSQYYSFNGTYYINLLPDFQLAGLISQLQYIYFMRAFSMTPAARLNESALAYETMELDYTYDGFTNQSLYQDYRYFQMDMNAVYNISLIRFSGQGLPIFFVSVIDSNQGRAPRFTSFQFRSQLTPGFQTRQNLTLTPTNRTSRNPRCGTVFQSLQGDGSSACFIAISVTCNSSQQCLYQLKISQIGVDATQLRYSQNSQTILPLVPPMPILTRHYVNGNVNGSGVIKYYYLPINYQIMGDALILLVKNSFQFTQQNGDSKLMVNIQNNTLEPSAGFNYRRWVFPTDQQQGRQSATGNYQQVEIVDVCLKSLNDTCFGTTGCGIIAGVVGMSNTPSNYRIKAFYSQNKLIVNQPVYVNQTAQRSGSFDYYWFVITEGINNQSAWFDYYVTVNSNTTGDKDLYVSLMDGREPNEFDYDLTSQLQGADIVRIASNSSIWYENNWNITSGVVVVVGVKLYQPTNYTVILAKAPDQDSPFLKIQRFNIGQSEQISLPDISSSFQSRNYTLMYMIYNWQQFDFAFTLTMNQGNSTFQYGVTGQIDQSNNLFSAIPFNQNNSMQFYNVTQGNYQSVQVQGSSCYNCWYFIRIDINSPYVMQFQVTASASNSIQGQYLEIFNGQPQQLYMNSGQTQQIKFILDSKDGWQLQGLIANGQVNVYIGLNPSNVGPQNYIWTTSGQAGQSAVINVKQIDPNFYFGTYYFVSIIASSNSNAVVTFTLKQTRSVMFIGNNHDYTYTINPANTFGMLPAKVTLYTQRELVKFHVFNVPGVSTGQAVYHQVTITITILDQNIFPVLYLNKVEMDSQPQYVNMLNFPNINSYQLVFGENPFYQLNSQEISYSFYGVAQQQWTQYTMAVYVYNWGLTNLKKNEYEIDVQVSIVDQCKAVNCDSNGNPIVQSTRPIVSSSHRQGVIQLLVQKNQLDYTNQSFIQ